MGVLLLPSVYHQWRRIRGNLHRGRPVGVHLPVLVVETLELQLQVGSAHECPVDIRLQLEHVVADCEVVF